MVVARTTSLVDLLNEWVVEVDGVRRARFVGPDAAYFAARCANEWRRKLADKMTCIWDPGVVIYGYGTKQDGKPRNSAAKAGS